MGTGSMGMHAQYYGIVYGSTLRSNVCSAKIFGAVWDCQVDGQPKEKELISAILYILKKSNIA